MDRPRIAPHLSLPTLYTMLPASPLNKCILIPLYFLLLSPAVAAQQQINDSLLSSLRAHPQKDTVRINLLNQVSRMYFTKDASMAASFGEEALLLSDSLHYTPGKIWALRNLALVENTKGHLDQQMQLTLNALKLAEVLGEPYMLGVLNNDVGNIFTELNSPRDALPYLKKSLAIKMKRNEKAEIGKTINNIGCAYIALKMYDSAMYYLQRAEKIKLELNDQRGLAYTYENMGIIAMVTERYTDALRFHQLSSSYYKEAGNLPGVVKANLNLAEVQIMLGDVKNADKNLDNAKALNDKLGNAKNELIYYKIRYELDSARKDYAAAFADYKAYSNRNIDFFNAEKGRQISRSEEKYEAEKKQRENVLLKKEQHMHLATIQQQRVLVLSAAALFLALLLITVMVYRLYKRQQELYLELNNKNQEVSMQNRIILEQNTTLENLNQVKDKIFSVISHDLRSPLAILEGLLFLLKDEKIDASQFRMYTDELWRDVKNTAYMMDNMLQWASNQMKGIGVKPDDFDLTLLLSREFDLLQTLARQKEVKLWHELNKNIMVYADPDMIRLVLRNLINNAIKFTPAGGEVQITAQVGNDIAEITVKDNGTGIPLENQHRIFSNIYYSTTGTQNEKGCGLGLHLSKDFVERNQGQIWFNSMPGTGSSFSFTIPLSEDTEINPRAYTMVVQDHPVNGVRVLRR
ncbi:MAG: tetratricopeptide repeat-containing sensor histidine kinase [Chitinophaga sp.]|uniref:tetratricopeptide repeat-containing sensor histidine kinase n=1 Tax=Chitinophaga sp. TaxID=1869181 RepID=UPI001AFEE0C5|nr:HAMP domain-containing sensor histidine kinase [Chitinophaga sp.]MBO9731052.1 tetratricopeptide repeat-containing sensor histidine kinase [Chitinophaga sp.]